MIRRLLSSEREQIAEHLKRLDASDRHMRFETSASDAFIDTYVTSIKFTKDAVYGAFDDSLVLRGVAHIAFSNDAAEVGLSVEANCRGKGMGSALLDRAIRIARVRRAKTFCSLCLAQNRWMNKHMAERGFSIERDHDTVLASTDLEPPNPLTVATEMFDEQTGWMDYTRRFLFNLAGIH